MKPPHPTGKNRTLLKTRCVFFCLVLSTLSSLAADYYVSPNGNDTAVGSRESPWRTIQHAADHLNPGDTAHVTEGTYTEKVRVSRSGSAKDGKIILRAEGKVTVSGAGIEGQDIFYLTQASFVRIEGFEIRDNLKCKDGSGIRVEGAGSHIELIKNRIHNIRGKDAMGITIYGRDPKTPISHLVIQGNEIYDCEPAQSETLTLNGNISDFLIEGNVVRDVNNIGICMIGGEAWINPDRTKVTRKGICRGNKVMRALSNYGDGYAAGIYVDGGQDIIVEDNDVSGCNLGIEVGAENQGTVASGIVVRNNRIWHNEKAGVVFGGFQKEAGRVEKCFITQNICFQNDQHKDRNGELWGQWAENNVIKGNTFWAGEEGFMVQLHKMARNNVLDENTYYSETGEDGLFFLLADQDVEGLTAWQQHSKQDSKSRFTKPRLRDPQHGDFTTSLAKPHK